MNFYEILISGAFTLLGAAIGAFLAGLYAVKAVEKHLNYDQNTRRVEEIESYLKAVESYLSYIKPSLRYYCSFKKSLKEDSDNETPLNVNTVEVFRRSKDEFNIAYEEVKKIDLATIPYNYFDEHLKSKVIVCSIKKRFEELSKELDDDLTKASFILKAGSYYSLNSDIDDLSPLYNKMIGHQKKAREELTDLLKTLKRNVD